MLPGETDVGETGYVSWTFATTPQFVCIGKKPPIHSRGSVRCLQQPVQQD
jgi:hypothetical protein